MARRGEIKDRGIGIERAKEPMMGERGVNTGDRVSERGQEKDRQTKGTEKTQ